MSGGGPIAGPTGVVSVYDIHMGETTHREAVDAPLVAQSAATGSMERRSPYDEAAALLDDADLSAVDLGQC